MASKLIRTDSFIARSFRKTILKYKVPSRIHRAACVGNVKKVNLILAYGEDVNKTDKKNRTPLHYGSAYGHSKVVALLIRKKCNVEICDKTYKTPLIKAVEHQHEECVEILLNNGANPDVQDIDGYCPLHYAVFCQTTAMAENLLSHNADMELKNKDGHTPLLLALNHNNQQVAELLIQNKANIHVVDKENRTALMLAAKYEEKHVIEMLFQGGIHGLAEDQSGKRALSYALASHFNVKLILDLTREEYKRIETRKAERDDSLSSSSEIPDPDDIKLTSEKGNNKSGIKNIHERKGEVCGDFWQFGDSRQSEKEVSQKKCPEDRPAIEETNEASKILEVNAVKTFIPDENSESETSTRKSRPVEPGPTSYGSNDKSYIKDNRGGKGEGGDIAFHSWSIDGKRVHQKQGDNGALPDVGNSDSEMDPLLSSLHASQLGTESFLEISMSPTENDNRGGKGEGGDNSFQSWSINEKCVHQKQGDNGALPDVGNSDSEMDPLLSSLHASQLGTESFLEISMSPTENDNHGGKGEGGDNSFQSRSIDEGKCGLQKKEEIGALPDVGNSDSEMDPLLSSLHASQLGTESFPEISMSPTENDMHGGEGEGCENLFQSQSFDGKHVHQKQGDNGALPDVGNSDSEMDPLLSSLHASQLGTESFLEISMSPTENVEEKIKKLPTERDQSQNLCEGAEDDDHDVDYDDESTEQKERRKTDYECFTLRKFKEHEGLREKTSNENKVKKQAHAMEDLNNLSQSSETASKDFELADPNYEKILLLIEQHKTSCKDSVSLSEIKDAVNSFQKTMEHKCHCSQCLSLIEKLAKMVKEVYGLKMELLEAKRENSKLELEKAQWRQQLSNFRCHLQEEILKRRNPDHFLKVIKMLREREGDYIKDRKIKRQLEIPQAIRDRNLSTSGNKLIQDFTSDETGKDLLDKYQRIEDKNSLTSLEIDTIKQENQEQEKKSVQDIEIVKGKYDDLPKTIKMKAAETLGENPFQHNEQFNNIKSEITKLDLQPGNEKQTGEKLDTEIKPYHDRLTAAPSCPQESQTSKGFQGLAFQRARDEYLHSHTKMNCNNFHHKVNSEVLSQELVKYEIKVSSVQNKFCEIALAFKEITLVLENVQRDLKQAEHQMKEIKHTRQSEQTKVNKYYGKQDSPEERSKLHNENTLVQQFQELHNAIDSKDTVTRIQGEIHDVVEKFQVSNKEHSLILEKAIEKLGNKWSHFEERLHEYENENTERQVSIKNEKYELPLKENSK